MNQESEASSSNAEVHGLSHADHLLAEGNRNLLCNEYSSAADFFGEALSIYVQEYGELAPQCASIYYQYGKALVLQGREELDLFTEDAEGASGDEEEDNLAENAEGENESNEQDLNDEAGTMAEGHEGTLQLAWEVLECARVVYARQCDISNLSKTHRMLGELAVISDKFEQGAEDLENAVAYAEQAGNLTSRKMAELHYLRGLAYFNAKKYPEAKLAYQKAVDIIKQDIAAMEAQCVPISDKGKEPMSDLKPDSALSELRALLPEMQDKLVELIQLEAEEERKYNEDKARVKATMVAAFGLGPANQAQASSSASLLPDSAAHKDQDQSATLGAPTLDGSSTHPVQDISGLVKKRADSNASKPVPNADTTGEAGCKRESAPRSESEDQKKPRLELIQPAKPS